MSGINSDQLHRYTLEIYTNLMEQFNPSLQRLVALGNSYVQAFQALADTSEAYFSALSKMGEQAVQTLTSRSLGDVLIQISESQRKLTTELEGVFRWFHNEVLQEMNNNVKLDKDYILSSRRRYEMEVRNQASVLERQLRRGGYQDGTGYTDFLKESQREALKEEERRYRFLAEKHCGFTQSFVHLMSKSRSTLQQSAEIWRDRVNETRSSRPQTPSEQDTKMNREDERGRYRAEREEQALGRLPSRGPSPQPSRSRSSSFGDSAGAGKIMRALVAYPPSSNPTLLAFSGGEIIAVLVPEPRNGWLYGQSEDGSRQGWFPASYVEPVHEAPMLSVPSPTLRNSRSLNNLLDDPEARSQSRAAPAAPPLPTKINEMSIAKPSMERTSEKRKTGDNESRPILFPRGTNPFATVKLKPTTTNDRSAPRI
ncbi:brain-specific angiogenesis inhibitor 1-associated protein 2-like protein 2 [Denticeps clupeoides]|uniref:Brain-specific angiogenesis inhibitor 1-associated protein 2-like protein 2 n=1 Tax=Denticeps clupeoides TaxID=299321 RepID=A0AAY4AP43_9TELE|nr:brain-specific angiogenesis inhibitor 1-associated protein 2-like protein 2 [Denticeps clupeoides]